MCSSLLPSLDQPPLYRNRQDGFGKSVTGFFRAFVSMRLRPLLATQAEAGARGPAVVCMPADPHAELLLFLRSFLRTVSRELTVAPAIFALPGARHPRATSAAVRHAVRSGSRSTAVEVRRLAEGV